MTPEPGSSRKRATIWDVARAAGVSHQTVSRYLKNEGGLKPTTLEKIDRAVAELDYRPNLIARSMRTRRSNRVAIVLPELTSFAPTPVLKGASQAARRAGYSTDVVGLEGDAVRRAEGALALLDSQQVDGVLSLTPLSETVIAAGDPRPIVIYGEYDDNMHSQGHLANGRPAADIVHHLADLGHRRFLHVAGADNWASALNRRAIYEQTIAKLGLESHAVIPGDWSVRSGYEAARDLPPDSGVTAVLAANDYVAMGAIRGFQDRGLRIPEDISVFGWDDEEFTRYFNPTISTVRLDRDTMGHQAMSSLLALINGDPPPTLQIDSTFMLLPRGSSGPAPR